MSKNYIPQNIKEFAERKYLMKEVNKVANWLSKLEKRIVGGTAIGKYYNTLILDITHHGAEIYISINDDGEVSIKAYKEIVKNFREFKKQFEINNNLKEVI